MELAYNGDVFEVEEIGSINMGCDGTDEYLHVRCLTTEANESTVERAVMQERYREPVGPGAYFCRNATAMIKPYSDNQYVVIVHHRYDN